MKLSLGGVHSAVLDDAGAAYTFGDNSRGTERDRLVTSVSEVPFVPSCHALPYAEQFALMVGSTGLKPCNTLAVHIPDVQGI